MHCIQLIPKILGKTNNVATMNHKKQKKKPEQLEQVSCELTRELGTFDNVY